jgi:hypothetical protein
MIELVFAIVIIAISVLSLPMMIQTTNKAIENNIIQEAIFAAEAILNESTTYYWDMHSADDNNLSGGYARVVNTGDCTLGGPPYKRVGQIHRQCLNNNLTTINTVGDTTSIEYPASIYNNTLIFEAGSKGVGEASYKNKYYATVTVQDCGITPCSPYFGESTDTNTTKKNIKETKIKITNSNGDTLIILRAYTTNIGDVKPESRIL